MKQSEDTAIMISRKGYIANANTNLINLIVLKLFLRYILKD